ncbi:MAG: hypothetical protein J6Y93_03855 [Treponema sp.]|nr:hypothetical protein [Treponema sp.]
MKKCLVTLIILLSSFSLFAQQEETKEKNYSYYLTIGPQFMLNTDSTAKSAPSPINFSFGFGMNFFEDKMLNFQPHLVFSTNYYLWDGENARPAEIENRTATSLNFMLDLNVMHSIGKMHTFQYGGGLGIFARFALLSAGVDENDAGGTAGSTAGDDVNSIGDWFWSGANFLYPQIALSYTYTSGKWQMGAESHVYFPFGSIIDGRGVDGLIVSLSFKVIFPR